MSVYRFVFVFLSGQIGFGTGSLVKGEEIAFAHAAHSVAFLRFVQSKKVLLCMCSDLEKPWAVNR